MAMTLEELRSRLSAIEPGESMYAGIGTEEIPLLEQLLRDPEPWMAARATFALSRIPDTRAVEMLLRAADDARQEVRVAVAASARILKPSDANAILLKVLADPDLGVRKFAVGSVSSAHDAAVHKKLRDLEARDPAPSIRDNARDRVRALGIATP